MTNFCPNCGKKADKDEKKCPVCGEKIASLSQTSESKKGKKKVELKLNIIIIVFVVCMGYFGLNIVSRYFNAGKNIAHTANSQKSELKILKRPSQKSYEYEENDDNNIVKKEKSSEAEYEEKETPSEKDLSKSKTLVLNEKEKYMNIMSDLNAEVEKMADSELNGEEESLLNYTSKIYKKYDAVLNMIYNDITSSLENGELENLKKDEVAWIKEKDATASTAVGSEDTSESDENWVYFDSLATSTKDRCYYLIHTYMY